MFNFQMTKSLHALFDHKDNHEKQIISKQKTASGNNGDKDKSKGETN